MEVREVTDIVETNDAVACGGVPQAEPKIAIRVKLDRAEERVVELKRGASVSRILEIVAAERGCGIEELVLAREGEDEPLTSGVVVDAGYPHKRPSPCPLSG